MKYLDKSFSSRPATDAYRDGWERAFGKILREYETALREKPRQIQERYLQGDWVTGPEPKKRGKR